jgi:ribosomal protein L7/L12
MPLTKAQEQEIRDLVGSNQRIAAVKRCREITGLGLNEALQMVNRLAFGNSGGNERPGSNRGAQPPAPAPLDPKARRDAEEAAMTAIREGSIMEAVKRYRQRTGLGLKESKDAVDILTLVHHSGGRVNASVAKALIAAVLAGREEEALTHLMAGAGYDAAEARMFIAGLGRLGIARRGCRGGCLGLAVVLLALLAGMAALKLGLI